MKVLRTLVLGLGILLGCGCGRKTVTYPGNTTYGTYMGGSNTNSGLYRGGMNSAGAYNHPGAQYTGSHYGAGSQYSSGYGHTAAYNAYR